GLARGAEPGHAEGAGCAADVWRRTRRTSTSTLCGSACEGGTRDFAQALYVLPRRVAAVLSEEALVAKYRCAHCVDCSRCAC
ncbi:hypothetical protein C8J57DRAFT_1724041, partial [Mycena rebaudengoi]